MVVLFICLLFYLLDLDLDLNLNLANVWPLPSAEGVMLMSGDMLCV